MLKKHKVIIVCSVLLVIAVTLGLVLGGLDQLDAEKYGLNYNYVTANFSDSYIYQGGLNFVGPSNVLLQVPKTYQTLDFPKIETFTKDFFPLQLSIQARYIITLSAQNSESQNFTILRSFYVNFSSNPNKIILPLISNQIIRIGSLYSSAYYQDAANYLSLEAQIEKSVTSILAKWADINVKILVASVVCRGVSANLEPLTRKITGLMSQVQRTQAAKVDMTNLVSSLQHAGTIKTQIVKQQIARVLGVALEVNRMGFVEPSSKLSGIQAVGQNLGFASSQLGLRPELYLVNSSVIF